MKRFSILFMLSVTLVRADCEFVQPEEPLRDLLAVAERVEETYRPPVNCIKDVSAAFTNIKKEVTPLALRTNEVFSKGSYRQLFKTRFGLDNHIQGIVRVPGTSTFILSGGDRYIKEANLFVVNFETGAGKSLLDKNYRGSNPKDSSLGDGFTNKVDIGSKDYWHAGGLAVLDNILAVPIENPKTKQSKIMFYDLTDPQNPVKLDTEILRPNSTTGTVLFFRNPEGKIVVGGSVGGKMEFFETNTDNIRDGFKPETKIIQTPATGQGTDMIRQCDGKLFIVDFNNTSSLAPIFYGKNYVQLFEVDINAGTSKLISKRVLDTNRSCNFKAAGSHHITEDGKLVLYGSSFYRKFGGEHFRMCQFSE